MFRSWIARRCPVAALALFALFALPAPRAHAASPARPSVRCAATIAHFDSVVGLAYSDRIAQWVTATAAAARDSDERIVAGLLRARLLMQGGRTAEAKPLAQAAAGRARLARDTLLESHALYVLAATAAFSSRPEDGRPFGARMLALATRARLRRDEGLARMILAYLDLLAGRFARAETGYRTALRRLSPTLDLVPRRITRVGLSRACFQRGHVDAARALDIELIRESRGVEDPVNEASALNNLAVHELLAGDPAEALPCYRRALELQRRMGRTREATTTATNLALALARMMRYDEASDVLEPLASTPPAGTPDWQRADILAQLASVRLGQDRIQQAESLAVRAWALSDSAHSPPDRQLAVTRATLLFRRGAAMEGVALLDRWVAALDPNHRDPDDALLVQAEAASLLNRDGHFTECVRRWQDVRSRLDTTAAQGHMKLGYALVNEALAAAGAHDEVRARALFGRAVGEWERGRLDFRSPEWRQVVESQGIGSWGSAASRMLAGSPGHARLRETFDLLQRVKARTFGDRLAGGTGARPVTARALQSAVLAPGELVLDAYPAHDSVLVFALTRETQRSFVVHDARGLARRIDRFVQLAHDGASAGASLRAAAARTLSADLLGPVADLLGVARVLVVSGGGELDGVPWALLPMPGSNRPLLGRVVIASVPSLSALASLRRGPAAPVTRGPLVVTGATGLGGRRLRGAEREVEFLGARYATADVRAPRSAAEFVRVLATAPEVTVIHVAAHFDHDPENPWNSGMLLGDPRRDASWIRPAALGAVRTRARLVTLAGCSTAGAHGVNLQGERGLATAFLAAGAGAVLGTLWPVEDDASAEFVTRFYRALDEGRAAAGALAQAQAGMRDSALGGDASRWAGFVLLGDPAVRVALVRR